jgi:hypothetical protein
VTSHLTDYVIVTDYGTVAIYQDTFDRYERLCRGRRYKESRVSRRKALEKLAVLALPLAQYKFMTGAALLEKL